MEQRAFEQALEDLLHAEVSGLGAAEKAMLVRRHAERLAAEGDEARFTVAFEPFVPGRRPIDESAFPGLGSSEELALVHRGNSRDDRLTFLVRCRQGGRPAAGFPDGADVLGTIQTVDASGRPTGVLPAWQRRDLRPFLTAVAAGVPLPPDVAPAHALVLDVERIFASPPAGIDAGAWLGFATQFHQRFRLALDVEVDGVHLAGATHRFEIHDEELFGSLYQRLVDRLLPWDTARQAAAAGRTASIAVHPWYPVLSIGMQKARYYMLAVTGDLIEERRMLTDPGWLLRVGLYLELLTCLGVCEAVRDEIDLLSPDERQAFEQSPDYAAVRARLDVAGWRRVWELREVAWGVGEAPTGVRNLLRKKAATLAFLHTHHADLEHAIELAGANLHNAQETWHRVFRDAERAVLTMNADAFPELAELPPALREVALWHESGSLGGRRLAPRGLTEIFGDQDGIFASACRQYRASMNHVALRMRQRGLMEFTGEECVPASASLFEAHLAGQPARLAALQRQDGYAGTLQVVAIDEVEPGVARQDVARFLERVDLLAVLSLDERQELAGRLRPIALSHLERIVIEGRAGTSLFILQEGALEVVRRRGGVERPIAVLHPPAVVGELSFLTGEKRSATVRALEGATVLELSAGLLRPLVERRPAMLESLQALLAARQGQAAAPTSVPGDLLASLRRAIFGRS